MGVHRHGLLGTVPKGPARYAMPGCDPWGLSTHDQEAIGRFCTLLTSLQERLRNVEDARLIPVSFPELDEWAWRDLARGHPRRGIAIAKQLGELVEWMKSAARRCGSLTVMGM